MWTRATTRTSSLSLLECISTYSWAHWYGHNLWRLVIGDLDVIDPVRARRLPSFLIIIFLDGIIDVIRLFSDSLRISWIRILSLIFRTVIDPYREINLSLNFWNSSELAFQIPEVRDTTEELIKTNMRESFLVTLLQFLGMGGGVTFMYFMNKLNDVEIS